MLERRRRNKHYDAVPGDDLGEIEDGERDLELGEGVGAGVGQQETGRIGAESEGQAGEGAKRSTVTEELDNWDENAEDEWDEAEADVDGAAESASKGVKRAD